jgi:hypothetical protein
LQQAAHLQPVNDAPLRTQLALGCSRRVTATQLAGTVLVFHMVLPQPARLAMPSLGQTCAAAIAAAVAAVGAERGVLLLLLGVQGRQPGMQQVQQLRLGLPQVVAASERITKRHGCCVGWQHGIVVVPAGHLYLQLAIHSHNFKQLIHCLRVETERRQVGQGSRGMMA